MKLNRKLMMVLALVLSVAMATSGTIAYLSDTDSDVNVMTLGKVDIEQIEQEWNGDELQGFTQSKPLYPAVSKDAEIKGNNETYPQIDAANVVDKYVSVKNTGKSEAYVRTVFAFEAGAYDSVAEFESVIGYTYNSEAWDWNDPIPAKIDGRNFIIVEAVHTAKVKAGESTVPSLQQVYMDKDCDNKHVEGIDGNKNGTYDIYVVSQAVQTAGFASAEEALIAGFKKITATSHPWTAAAEDETPDMTVKTVFSAAELQTALDEAQNGTLILLGADITGDVTAPQKPGVEVTIDGANHKFAGVIIVDGKSATYTTAGLNIKNITFKADTISADACIRLGNGTNATRYTCNVTVENCTFDVPGAVGVKSYTGGDKNLTIVNCTATDACHSLIQAKGIEGILVKNCTVKSKNGLNFNNSTNVIIEDSNVDTQGYAARFGEGTAANGAAETYRIENCALTSANDDGDATIILRGTADKATLTLVNTVIVGNPDITNNTDAAVNNESAVKADLVISTAEELFAFAKAVNDGNDKFSGKTVVLANNINLKNQDWEPIGQTGKTEFKGTFDGRGHIIYNLNVDSTAHTDKHYSSGLFGWAEAGYTIKNLTIDGATVTGNHNVAVVVGYTYSGKLENITVKNATVTAHHANGDACGDKAGTIVGYMGNESRVKNLYAEDCIVKAGRDAGALVGLGYNVSFSAKAPSSFKDVTVSATGECTGANIYVANIGRVIN